MRPDLITISREYGAGASDLAARLGETLGWPVLDAEIPHEVAWRLGIPDDSLEEWDEHAPGLLESIGHALVMGSPDVVLDPTYARRPDAEDVAGATRALLLERAATAPLIVVGHGGQAIFHERPGTLHVRLVAPIEVRAERVTRRRSITRQEAVAIAQSVDRDRMNYVKQFHHRDVRDPLLYAIIINTGSVAMPEAEALVLSLLGEAEEAR
jgi:cytidylate kinase